MVVALREVWLNMNSDIIFKELLLTAQSQHNWAWLKRKY